MQTRYGSARGEVGVGLEEEHFPEAGCRFRAKNERPKRISGLLPDRQDKNLALTGLRVPNLLDSGVASPKFDSKLRR